MLRKQQQISARRHPIFSSNKRNALQQAWLRKLPTVDYHLTQDYSISSPAMDKHYVVLGHKHSYSSLVVLLEETKICPREALGRQKNTVNLI